MPITNILSMAVVPEKFSSYVIERSTEKSAMVSSGIATPDEVVAGIINSLPEGGRFITLPHFNPLNTEEDDDTFGEHDVPIGDITTGSATATVLLRQRAWGATDLSHVLAGADPMGAVAQLVADYWAAREQKTYLAILKGLLDPTKGALKSHVNDVSGKSGESACIGVENTLDTKQTMGDAASSLGLVFMHSATYTQLQKQQNITTEYDNELKIKIDSYLGYRVVVDDGMPFKNGVYDTFFIGAGAFVRQDGSPSGFIGTETDRDKIGAKNYLINRRCMIVHPRGLSWENKGTYLNAERYYPSNADLAVPENWKLVIDHKKVPVVALRHKLG